MFAAGPQRWHHCLSSTSAPQALVSHKELAASIPLHAQFTAGFAHLWGSARRQSSGRNASDGEWLQIQMSLHSPACVAQFQEAADWYRSVVQGLGTPHLKGPYN